MALVIKDRVKVTTTTTGTGAFAIGGAQFGFQGFSSFADGDTTYYTAVDNATGDWETGLGTYSTTGPSLARTQVLASSTGTAINFGAGPKDLFVVYPAGRAVLTDGAVLTGPLSVPAGASGAQVPQAQEVLLKSGNLSGIADIATARSNLGLGSAATRTALGSSGALYSRDSILGTVSQSGGVPTGAIIERGSNANGQYVRWADGTQICWHFFATVSGGTTWTYPAAFTGGVIAVAAESDTASPRFFLVSTSATTASLRAFNADINAFSDANARVVAIGGWF